MPRRSDVVEKHSGNPILTFRDVPWPCTGAYNPGCVKTPGGTYALAFRQFSHFFGCGDQKTFSATAITDLEATGVRDVTVPANSSATVHIPAEEPGGIPESGVPCAEAPGVALLRSENGETLFEVGSGVFRFTFPAPRER